MVIFFRHVFLLSFADHIHFPSTLPTFVPSGHFMQGLHEQGRGCSSDLHNLANKKMMANKKEEEEKDLHNLANKKDYGQ